MNDFSEVKGTCQVEMVKGGRKRERENENGDRKVEERIKYVYAV